MDKYIAIIILVALLLGLISWLINIYNKMVFLNKNIDKSFANIDILLKQRVDEIPNLVEITKQFTNYEKDILLKLTQLRAQFISTQDTNEKINLINEINSSLRNIFVIAENYPQLQANQFFVNLQHRISEIENNIADRREFFNESVTIYNTHIQEFPNIIFAKLTNHKEKNLLVIPEKEKEYYGIKF